MKSLVNKLKINVSIPNDVRFQLACHCKTASWFVSIDYTLILYFKICVARTNLFYF
jgi:hypothetical protein